MGDSSGYFFGGDVGKRSERDEVGLLLSGIFVMFILRVLCEVEREVG